VEASNEISEQDEAVGERAVSRDRRDQALVWTRADRVNGDDHAAASSDLERPEQLGEPVELLARQLGPDELRVAVGKAGAGQPPLVDEREHFGLPVHPLLPGFGDERHLRVFELGEGADMLGRVDDDLLPLERGVEVRNDPNSPGVTDPKRLGRRSVLTAGAEGATLELILRCGLDLG
jgi:hypothetical protein